MVEYIHLYFTPNEYKKAEKILKEVKLPLSKEVVYIHQEKSTMIEVYKNDYVNLPAKKRIALDELSFKYESHKSKIVKVKKPL